MPQTLMSLKKKTLNKYKYIKMFFMINWFFVICSESRATVQVFYKIGVLKNFAKFTEKHVCWSLFFDKVMSAGSLQLYQKMRLQHRCFSVNFTKFLKAPFLQNTSGRLLLKPQWNRSRNLQVFFKIDVLKCFGKFTGNYICRGHFLVVKNRLQHRCFPVNFTKYITILFFEGHLRAASARRHVNTPAPPF